MVNDQKMNVDRDTLETFRAMLKEPRIIKMAHEEGRRLSLGFAASVAARENNRG